MFFAASQLHPLLLKSRAMYPVESPLSASSILCESPQSDCLPVPPLKISDAITKE